MRKMSSSLWKKGMAAALSAVMMFGVFGGTKTSVSGASGKKVDANMDGRANETVTVNNAKGARMIKVGSYVKSGGELKTGKTYYALRLADGYGEQRPDYKRVLKQNTWVTVSASLLPVKLGRKVSSPTWYNSPDQSYNKVQKGDTYFALNSKDNTEFVNLFDSCNGTIAFNETFKGSNINTTDGKYSRYGCDNGGVAGQPILLYHGSSASEYVLSGIYVKNTKTYKKNQVIKKSDFTVYAKYVNKKNSKDVKWGKADTNYIALSQTSAQNRKFKVKVQYPTTGADMPSLAAGAKTKELTLNTAASTAKKVIVATGTAKTSRKVQLSWTKTKGADAYRIYGNQCGKKSTPKYLKTVKKGTKTTITKIGKRKLKSKGSYKFYVRPYQNVNKQKKNIGKSNTAHVLMRAGSRYANASSVSVKKKSITLKKGRTAVIKAKVKVPSGKKQPKNHGAKIRYMTSKSSVVSVNSKGKIKAKKASKAAIYVISENGKYKKVSVTVK